MLRGLIRRSPLGARIALPKRGLDEFFDNVTPAGQIPLVGRQWTVVELRQKSFDDLHRLWWVLYKEKNMLMSEKLVSRRKGEPDIKNPNRIHKVNGSMKAIRHVVDERDTLKQKHAKDKKFDDVRAAAYDRGDAPKSVYEEVARLEAKAKRKEEKLKAKKDKEDKTEPE